MMMSWACRSRYGRKPWVPKMLSPVQMRRPGRLADRAQRVRVEVSTSSHIRSYGSIARASLIAPPSLKRNATSSAIPTSGPSSSRNVPTIALGVAQGRPARRRRPRAASGRRLGVRHGPSSGNRFVLRAVKPRSRTSAASARRSSVVSTCGTPSRSARAAADRAAVRPVQPQLVAQLAAQQLPDRRVQHLAANVPERRVDPGHRLPGDAAGVAD